MTEKIRRVGVDGSPDPEEHPLVLLEVQPGKWESVCPSEVRWNDHDVWVPWAPPAEYLTEPEPRWTVLRQPGHAPAVCRDGKQVDPDEVVALLNDQPPVPRALVEWVTDRLPNNDEYPVLWNATDTGEVTVFGGTDRWDRMDPMSPGERWVSLSVLLDAAGLGER